MTAFTPQSPTLARIGQRAAHRATGNKLVCDCGGGLNAVVDSRVSVMGADDEPIIRRRRKCSTCGKFSVTIELKEEFIATFRAEVLKELAIRIIAGDLK